jgi:beta-lactam-binding protein with PASTA domain
MVGYNSTSGTITGSYASGTASAGTSYANDLVGIALITSVIKSSTGLTVDQMKDYLWYKAAGWDFAIWQQTVVMPNLVGQDLDSAGQLLCPVGCTIGTVTQEYHATVPAGQIISQSVAAGSGTAGTPTLIAHGVAASPKTGDVVDVTVSLGDQVEVPNTLGLTQAAAEALLAQFDFTATVTTATSETVAAGYVSEQSPAGGTSATWQSAIAITVSTGPSLGIVPGVLGLSAFDAETEIQDAGFLASVTTATSETVAAGIVFEQTPQIGTVAPLGSTIAITVSTGPSLGVIPGVLGLTLAAATSAIEADGFVADSDTDYSADFAADLVMAQTPAAGTTATLGDTVTVTVSLGPVQVTVPNVVGSTTAAATAAIEAVGLTATATTAYSTSVAIGKVINQTPAASATVDLGSAVAIVSSIGALVPNVVGQTYSAARWAIENQLLKYSSTNAYSSTVTVGSVINQTPAAGSAVAPASTVAVIISLGTQTGPIIKSLSNVREIIANSTVARTWLGVSTYALALARIHYYGCPMDGDPVIVLAPAGGWNREQVTIAQDYLTSPSVTVEFAKSVTKTDSDETVFTAIATAIDSVMLAMEAETTWPQISWQPDSEGTPARTKASATTDYVFYRVNVSGNLYS